MSPTPSDLLRAADRLHDHLLQAHWNGHDVLLGPDPGVRFNARVGRFVKSYVSFLPWQDDLAYLQAQGYWIFDNWLLYELRGDNRYRDLALRTSDAVLTMQRRDGYWEYPNPEWRGRVSTVEGCFAALGLIDTYARTDVAAYLDGAVRWHAFLHDGIGFRRQPHPEMLAVNYFANSDTTGGGVPNNSTLVLWLMARLAEVTGDGAYLANSRALVEWLAHVQLPSGELPYSVAVAGEGRPHFLCYQYNAFEFMDLAQYYRITGDEQARSVLGGLARYLRAGLSGGVAPYDCHRRDPEVAYYTPAVAQALSQATELGLADERAAVEAAFAHTLRLQRPDGSFPFHSRRNYRILTDRRSYPRYLSMILNHLLMEVVRVEAAS